jgi:hypothetical protein
MRAQNAVYHVKASILCQHAFNPWHLRPPFKLKLLIFLAILPRPLRGTLQLAVHLQSPLLHLRHQTSVPSFVHVRSLQAPSWGIVRH